MSFWTMLAHYHGKTWNGSALARSMGLSDKTVRSYLDILTGTFMVRQLQPWHENRGKRQVTKVTRSLRFALDNLRLDHLLVIYPGIHAYPVDEKITVFPLIHLAELPDYMDL